MTNILVRGVRQCIYFVILNTYFIKQTKQKKRNCQLQRKKRQNILTRIASLQLMMIFRESAKLSLIFVISFEYAQIIENKESLIFLSFIYLNFFVQKREQRRACRYCLASCAGALVKFHSEKKKSHISQKIGPLQFLICFALNSHPCLSKKSSIFIFQSFVPVILKHNIKLISSLKLFSIGFKFFALLTFF